MPLGANNQSYEATLIIMIRQATIKDTDALCDLSEQHQSLMPNIDYHDKIKEWLSAQIESDSLCFVYERNNNILGFILAEKLVANGLMVWTFAVLPEYLNKGIGIKLLRHLEQESLTQNREWIIGYATESFQKLSKRLGYKANNNQYTEVVKLLNDTNTN